MNDAYLEARLLAARPRSHEPNTFAERIMEHIQHEQTLSEQFAAQPRWRLAFRWQYKKALLALAAAISAALLGITSYAYATGTNPVSLIQRWISGNVVKVQYQGRTYQYGTSKSYSDSTITAFAELENVRLLDFQQENLFTAPHDGAEFFTPSHYTYIQPWVGTLEKLDSTALYIRQQFVTPSPVDKTQASSQLVAIPRAQAWMYAQGTRLSADGFTNADIGKNIYIAEAPYLRHVPGDKIAPATINQYFAYELTHSLTDIEAAEPPAGSKSSNALHDPNEGALSNLCVNNAADTCSPRLTASGQGDDLYSQTVPSIVGTIGGNPDCVPFGEGDPQQINTDLLMRNVEGHVTAVNANGFTIKTSSGATWTLAYNGALQRTFARLHKPLRVGDDIGGTVLSVLTDLDNRQIPNDHIYDLRRL